MTPEQEADIKRRAQEYVDRLTLDTEEQFAAALEKQLARLMPLTHPAKRRATILGLAQVGLTLPSAADVFKSKETVAARTYYDRGKDWHYGTIFREVEETVVLMYRRWSAGTAAREAAREFAEREADLRQREWEAHEKMTSVFMEMLNAPLYRVETEEEDEDGRKVYVVNPARWTMDSAVRLADASSKLGRLALGMTPGGKQELEVSMRDALPPGITPAQAEQAKLRFAKYLAAADEELDEDDEEDEE